MQIEITETVARKVLDTIDAGLSHGIGKPVPGQMCVEAAVCFALGMEHGDEPVCVAPALRQLKIYLNDKSWSSTAARAKGLRRLGLAQLGSKDTLDEPEFVRRISKLAITSCTAKALRSAASVQKDQKHKDTLTAAADRCESEGTRDAAVAGKAAAAAYAAYAAYAADAAAYADADADAAAKKKAYDESLAEFAEEVVQILIEMKAPGCQWLFLTEAA